MSDTPDTPVLGANILVVGSPGSGKSTFARKLAERTGLPLHHLDALYWAPGWQRRHTSEGWGEIQETLVAGDRWIIDGNYYSTLDIRIAAADTVILLDVPPWRALFNIFGRVRNFSADSRPDMAPHCPERFNWPLVRTVLRYPWRDRPKILALAREHGKELVVLRGHAAARTYLDSVVRIP